MRNLKDSTTRAKTRAKKADKSTESKREQDNRQKEEKSSESKTSLGSKAIVHSSFLALICRKARKIIGLDVNSGF